MAQFHRVATTITVDTTAGFPSSGTLKIGTTEVTYTGLTSTTFTGCSGTPAALMMIQKLN